MLKHRGRRATLRSAQIGPLRAVAAGGLSDVVPLLVRAPSPAYAPLLADKPPAAITPPQSRQGML